MTSKSTDFIGTWELVPAESKYEIAQVPKKATLDIRAEKGGLSIRLEWTDFEDKLGELEHGFPFNKPTLVNGNEMTLVHNEDGSLETIVRAEGGGEELSRTRRTLSSDRQKLELTQAGTLPDKGSFTNVSTYRRVK